MVTARMFFAALLFFALLSPTQASTTDASSGGSSSVSSEVDGLLEEAQNLFILRHPIDARAKLQHALQLAPQDYRPHMMLGAYYLSEVAHFPLADRYIRTAEMLFEKQYGSDKNHSLDPTKWREHARLLYLLSEGRLNLDDYEGSLKVLDRFGALYWDDWYPGSRAWVLMKLKRFDEAIKAAQAGLLRGADPTRTYNILGILLSARGGRELSLQAFGRAIRAERALGSTGQAATPLNNAGEVYRELFQDSLAEAAWLRALRLPDGCDHILPSLNLALLQTDELRLFQAERSLSDFVACFAAHPLRSDTEHRALLALQRGRIALWMGDPWGAETHLAQSGERQQWFGKIGTNEDDLRFSALAAMAEALRAQLAAMKDRTSIPERLRDLLAYPVTALRAWWLERRARQLAVEELDSFEDLEIRSPDAMIEYPTLGTVVSGLPLSSVRRRLSRLLESDGRSSARPFYELYFGEALLRAGRKAQAAQHLEAACSGFRERDRLAHARCLGLLVQAKRGWFSRDLAAERPLLEELYDLSPPTLRYFDLALPVQGAWSDTAPAAKRVRRLLLGTRFKEVPEQTRYSLSVSGGWGEDTVSIGLVDRATAQTVASVSGSVKENGDSAADLVDRFLAKAFSHRSDPPQAALPELQIMDEQSTE